MEETTFRERVQEAYKPKEDIKEIPIKFPRQVLRDFNRWSYDNANDCYWLAIEKLMIFYETEQTKQKLLDIYKEHGVFDGKVQDLYARDDVLITQIEILRQEIDSLKAKQDNVIKKETPNRRGFGKVEDAK